MRRFNLCSALPASKLRLKGEIMVRYIYDRDGWPDLEWNKAELADQLAHVRHRQGRLLGRMDALGFPLRDEAALRTLTEDVLKSSEIEGEILDKAQVRSSIARRLGIDIGALTPADRHVEGIVEMMLDATQRFDQPLTTSAYSAGMPRSFRPATAG